jgi:hypothetical protein
MIPMPKGWMLPPLTTDVDAYFRYLLERTEAPEVADAPDPEEQVNRYEDRRG